MRGKSYLGGYLHYAVKSNETYLDERLKQQLVDMFKRLFPRFFGDKFKGSVTIHFDEGEPKKREIKEVDKM